MNKGKEKGQTVFGETLKDLLEHPKVREMKSFRHHRVTNTYTHCRRVSERSYKIARALHLNVDEESLARGAMLHDFYLYCFHDEKDVKGFSHSIHHPETALENATRYFHLNPMEENIILSHMWPLTITKMPHSKEAFLVCIADKVCAIEEFVFGIQR